MENRRKHSLDGRWNLCFTLPQENKKINTIASVPGNIEPVLVSLGFMEDYMPADYEYATAMFETVDDWCYTLSFNADDMMQGWTQQLVFEGIDTIADIYLNGEHI